MDRDLEFVQEVLRSIYVDDLASSKPDVPSAYDFYSKLRKRFVEAGLNMHKWLTNDQGLGRWKSLLQDQLFRVSQLTDGTHLD